MRLQESGNILTLAFDQPMDQLIISVILLTLCYLVSYKIKNIIFIGGCLLLTAVHLKIEICKDYKLS